MYVEILSTRRTRIGTLRRGSVRMVDPTNPHVKAAILPMVNGGAARVLTDEEVEARRAKVESLEVPAHVLKAAERAESGSVEAMEAADTALAAAAEKIDALERHNADEIAELEGRLKIAEEERDAANVRANEAEASHADAMVIIKGMEESARVAAESDAAPVAAESDAAPVAAESDGEAAKSQDAPSRKGKK